MKKEWIVNVKFQLHKMIIHHGKNLPPTEQQTFDYTEMKMKLKFIVHDPGLSTEEGCIKHKTIKLRLK